jgi:lysophospholipase L1-like esterase
MLLGAVASLALAAPVVAVSPRAGWVASWSASPARPGLLAGAVPDASGTGGRTVRDRVHLTLGGSEVRVRLSNVFGDRTAVFTDLRVALAGAGPAARAGTAHRLRFAGSTTARVPPGRELTSDAIGLRVRAGQDLQISIYAATPTGQATVAGSLDHTNYLSSPGDASGATDRAAFPVTSTSWYWLDGVDVIPGRRSAGIVALGDSITAGYDSTRDANRDWVDRLAVRLQLAGRSQPVLNAGIAGNNLHADSPCYGQSALRRLTRDALNQPGARYVILDEGDNDITHPVEPASAPLYGCLVHRRISTAGMIADFTLAAQRVRATHRRVIGVTLSPFGRYAYWSPAVEAERAAINRWIRTTRVFDGIIDFDHALRDPAHPSWLAPGYDSGDGLHPNDAGHAVMARSIPLSLFTH